MSGLRLTVVDAGPLKPDKGKIVAFAPGTVSISMSFNAMRSAMRSGPIRGRGRSIARTTSPISGKST
jgi:hypothetical protein